MYAADLNRRNWKYYWDSIVKHYPRFLFFFFCRSVWTVIHNKHPILVLRHPARRYSALMCLLTSTLGINRSQLAEGEHPLAAWRIDRINRLGGPQNAGKAIATNDGYFRGQAEGRLIIMELMCRANPVITDAAASPWMEIIFVAPAREARGEQYPSLLHLGHCHTARI